MDRIRNNDANSLCRMIIIAQLNNKDHLISIFWYSIEHPEMSNEKKIEYEISKVQPTELTINFLMCVCVGIWVYVALRSSVRSYINSIWERSFTYNVHGGAFSAQYPYPDHINSRTDFGKVRNLVAFMLSSWATQPMYIIYDIYFIFQFIFSIHIDLFNSIRAT